jgi:hypothetical protein
VSASHVEEPIVEIDRTLATRSGSMDRSIEAWKSKIEIIRLKKGRTLTAAILRVSGNEAPPNEALVSAAAEWRGAPAGQIVRRPDEDGSQIYWVNVPTSP